MAHGGLVMKAAIVLDDWKTPVFIRHLQEAGFSFVMKFDNDMLTILEVSFEQDQMTYLTNVAEEAAEECEAMRRQADGG